MRKNNMRTPKEKEKKLKNSILVKLVEMIFVENIIFPLEL